MLGFLARAVEHRPGRARHVRRRLQQQRRLADAGLAAEQHERSGDDAAAEHAIEFVDARADAARAVRSRCPSTGARCRARRRARSDARPARRPRPPRPAGAPRRASSTRRTRSSAPASWATARRTPGRRRRWTDALTSAIIALATSDHIATLLDYPITRSSVIDPFDPRSDPAQDLARDRPNLRGHLAHVDALVALRSDDDDLVARRHVAGR